MVYLKIHTLFSNTALTVQWRFAGACISASAKWAVVRSLQYPIRRSAASQAHEPWRVCKTISTYQERHLEQSLRWTALKAFCFLSQELENTRAVSGKRDECEWSPKFQWTPHAVTEVDVKFGSWDVIFASVQLRHGKGIVGHWVRITSTWLSAISMHFATFVCNYNMSIVGHGMYPPWTKLDLWCKMGLQNW